MVSIQTRSTAAEWLVGPSAETLISGMSLPTPRHVLSLFFNQHKVLKYTVRESTRHDVREISFWNMVYIPTIIERIAIEKFENIFEF